MTQSVPLRVAIANDYEVVVRGLATMLEPFRDRVLIVEIVAGVPATEDCDIVLYETFAAPQGHHLDPAAVCGDWRARRLVVYSWNLDPELVASTLAAGVSGYLSKQLTADELVCSLERIHSGEKVVSPTPPPETVALAAGDWPGRQAGLTEREAEIIALITQGLSNDQVASRTFLSINTVKSYIRTSYRKMGVTSRSRAVLWGLDHGFRPDHVRVQRPNDGAPT